MRARLLIAGWGLTAALVASPLSAQPRVGGEPPTSAPLAPLPEASPEVAAAVQRHLQQLADPEQQASALQELVRLGPPALGPLLRVVASSEAGWAGRSGAAWALGELGDARALAPLQEVWGGLPSSAPGLFRVQLASALGSLGELGALRSMLTPPSTLDKVILAKAATLLASYRDAEAIPLLKPYLTDPDVGVFFAIALGRLGDASGQVQLKEVLREGVLRDHAAIALGLSGDTTVLYQLRFALKNADPFVRRDAVEGLGRLKDAESLGVLESLAASDPDVRVREVAAKVVKRLKPRGRAR